MRDARAGYEGSEAEKQVRATMRQFAESVRVFFRERLEFYLKDVRGYAYDVVKAVLARRRGRCGGRRARAEAVKQVLHMPEFQAIGAACKRMRNILRQAEEKGINPAASFEDLPDSALKKKRRWPPYSRSMARVEALRRKKEYGDALFVLSTAREPVDAFFDKVMVMAEDAQGAREPAGSAADVA